MKNTYMLVVSIWALLFSILKAQSEQERFEEINESRGKRSALIEYLKHEGKFVETKDGTLKGIQELNKRTQSILSEENNDRLLQFAIVAKLEGKSNIEIAKMFAERMGVDLSEDDVDVLLRIHGSNTVGASLAPALVKQFLETRGYSDIVINKEGVESTISFNQPGKKTIGVIEIKAHGSSTAFGETSLSKNVGLEKGFADMGMASRQVKEAEVELLKSKGLGDFRSPASEFPIALDGVAIILNSDLPLRSLTTSQIAKIFAGQIVNWKEVGGPDLSIRVLARDEQSGTWDTFKARVLKPSKLALVDSAERFEDSRKLVHGVASHSGAIGFCGLAYVDSSVRGLAVSSANGLTAFQPTRLTVKTQDYPLSRLLYFYLPVDSKDMARDFVRFTMSNEGQAVVDNVGLVGQGLSTQKDMANADKYKRALLTNRKVPKAYKETVKKADRRNSQSNIRFALGSNQPDINSMNNLNRLADFLTQSGNENLKTILIGFTDSSGSADENRDLSRSRAQSVADLLKMKGVKNIQVAGFGEDMPVADNKTEVGRSKNRRVEIWLQR